MTFFYFVLRRALIQLCHDGKNDSWQDANVFYIGNFNPKVDGKLSRKYLVLSGEVPNNFNKNINKNKGKDSF